MANPPRRERQAKTVRESGNRPRSTRMRLLQLAAIVIVIGAAVGILVRSSRTPGGAAGALEYQEVGRDGAVFTVSVPRARADDEEYLMRIAEQISARERQAGGSGQISVMVWPDDVPVPKRPPTTEFDASMRTQAAGIFINPALNIKHLIRFKNGETVSERDFGRKTR